MQGRVGVAEREPHGLPRRVTPPRGGGGGREFVWTRLFLVAPPVNANALCHPSGFVATVTLRQCACFRPDNLPLLR